MEVDFYGGSDIVRKADVKLRLGDRPSMVVWPLRTSGLGLLERVQYYTAECGSLFPRYQRGGCSLKP